MSREAICRDICSPSGAGPSRSARSHNWRRNLAWAGVAPLSVTWAPVVCTGRGRESPEGKDGAPRPLGGLLGLLAALGDQDLLGPGDALRRAVVASEGQRPAHGRGLGGLHGGVLLGPLPGVRVDGGGAGEPPAVREDDGGPDDGEDAHLDDLRLHRLHPHRGLHLLVGELQALGHRPVRFAVQVDWHLYRPSSVWYARGDFSLVAGIGRVRGPFSVVSARPRSHGGGPVHFLGVPRRRQWPPFNGGLSVARPGRYNSTLYVPCQRSGVT